MAILNEYKEYITPYLQEKENILWCDKPTKKFLYVPADIFSVIMGAFWILFSAFWFVLTFSSESSSSITPYIAIGFFVAGLWFLVLKNVLEAIKRSNIVYAITNKRVLVINTTKEYCEQYEISDIEEIDTRKRGQIGSIFFFFEKHSTKKYSTIGIFGINNIEDVEAIILSKVRKKK